MSTRWLAAALVAFAGAAAFTACLLSIAAGMRDVMVTDGGFCASGGPYVIAHQCSSSDVRLIMVGIFGALITAGFYAAGTAGLGSKAASAGLLLWAALFGTLGWNFLSVGRHGASGMLLTGALFIVMAAGGLIPLLFSLAGDLRGGGRPNPVRFGYPPLVQAAVPAATTLQPGAATTFQPGTTTGFQPAGAGAWQPGTAPSAAKQADRSGELLRTGVWLVVSLAGSAFGIALSSSLITMLR
jgi:hypothetical protein